MIDRSMTNDDLLKQLEECNEKITNLEEELELTHTGLLALTMELEQRVDERTDQLKARAYEQSVVALISQKALVISDIDMLMDEAVRVVAKTIGAEYCLILACTPDEEVFRIQAGASNEDRKPDTKLPIWRADETTCQSRNYNETLITEDFQSEARLKVPGLLYDQGVVGGVSTLIHGNERQYGFLDIYSTNQRNFTRDDIHFMETIANVLAGAIERKQAEEKLKYIGLHDSLTNLYNRNYFEEEMERISKGRHNSAAIIMCDLDGLKIINDTLGHKYGDKILKSAADVLRKSFRNSDVVARIGGDEFVVLLNDINESSIEASFKRIETYILEYNAAHPELPLFISLGYAIDMQGCENMHELLKKADKNMYYNKMRQGQSARDYIFQTISHPKLLQAL